MCGWVCGREYKPRCRWLIRFTSKCNGVCKTPVYSIHTPPSPQFLSPFFPEARRTKRRRVPINGASHAIGRLIPSSSNNPSFEWESLAIYPLLRCCCWSSVYKGGQSFSYEAHWLPTNPRSSSASRSSSPTLFLSEPLLVFTRPRLFRGLRCCVYNMCVWDMVYNGNKV